jgi:hypothetical protein
MALTDPVVTGPQDGTIMYDDGSIAELKTQPEHTGGQCASVERRVRAGDDAPVTPTRRRDRVRPLRRDHGI